MARAKAATAEEQLIELGLLSKDTREASALKEKRAAEKTWVDKILEDDPTKRERVKALQKKESERMESEYDAGINCTDNDGSPMTYMEKMRQIPDEEEALRIINLDDCIDIVQGELIDDQLEEKEEKPAPQLGLVLVPPAEKFKTPNTLVMEMAARALDRNFKYFSVVHGDKLDAIQKLQDKIDELNNETRRHEKILKIAEKISLLQEELEAFESMFSFTKSAKNEVEPYVQLEFDLGMDKAS